ncbi:hypothetical protein Ccar_03575 [Clostridium carboxidivorans P7]|uniref:Restriction modification system DNA specificity domain protein n=1 Tax=Clostridium carboxidivorans P7 TaxID=536227 RepID=C6PP55_9CLOT|nr:restriction endonuclease subunit S [Clostridium carboxidivorans]AKN29961.1 hypothetical protein Ccar_03575 [Clostridium carboxidivorans P7]EET88933.1 restriction modification system DNA specificity domain protein [Clostridium carboxidivorans P7]
MAKKQLTLEERLEEAIIKDGPYEVPENWVWIEIGRVIEVVSGGTPKSNVSDYYENGDVAWITPADLSGYSNIYISRGKRNITKLGLEKSSAKLMPKNSVLMSSRAPIGYVAIAKNEISTNQGFKNFLPSPVYLPKYLYFYLKYSKDLIETYASGTTFLEISGAKAKLLPFPIAPLKEQQRIVDRIESLFEKLDKAKELIEEAREEFEKRKSAILEKAFRGELTEKWRDDTKINSFKDTKFEELFAFIGGGTPSKANKEYWNGEINWASVKDIKNNYLYDTIDKITEEGVKNSSTNVAKNGEIILVTRISPGKVTIAQKDIAINQDLKIVRPKIEEIDYKYMYYLFLYKEKDLISKSQGTTVKGITINELNKIQISLPVLEEQKEIVRILDKLLEEESKIEELTQLEDQIELVKKSILAKAFRGELGTNSEEDESALDLLREILSKDI